jgi:multidrug efflux pump subunit AcrB
MVRGGETAGGLIRYFVRHRTVANLLLVLMIASGIYALTQMRAQYFPDVVVEEVTVQVGWDGAGPEDVDRAIVQVLEPALLAVDGVAASESRSTPGSARITLEFAPGTDLDRAAEEVQTAVEAVRDLPEGADDPVVRRGAWRDQVTDVVLSGPVGIDQLARFADEFTARLFAAGVTRTTIQGLAAPQIMVEVPTAALVRHDLNMTDIAEAIAAEVSSAPAGDVGDGAARVRTGAERRSAAEVAAIVLRSDPQGGNLTIGDVATVTASGVDRGRASFVGQNPAMTVRVDRTADGDAIDIQARVAEIAAELEATLPPGVTVDLVRTRAEQISDRLELLLDNALLGLALVVGLLFLFLNARLALWVAVGIPVAMLAGIAGMYAAGLTLNMISLFALIITLGIVVDDAIVVAEHADWRARRLGEPPLVAAEAGALRMGAPVVASTLTTVIAFAGLVVIGGRFGELIADIPFTVSVVLIASLVECFLILPNHLVHALGNLSVERWYDAPSRAVNRGMRWVQERLMKPLVRLVLRARYPVLAGCVALLASCAALFIRGDVQFRFFNAPEQSSVSGNFSMLPGASRADSVAMMRELQRAVDQVAAEFEAEHGLNPVTYVLAEVGGGAGRGLSGADTKSADLLGGISVELVSPDLRPYSSAAFVAALQDAVRPHPRMEELSFRGARFGPGGSAISVDLYGAEATALKAAAEALKLALAPFPEVSGLEDTLAYDKDELILTLTPQGQALGFGIEELGRALRDRLNGIEAASFPDGPRSATIRVELPAGELTSDFLERTLMRASEGVWVPLADIVRVERTTGFSSVLRENGLRVVTVTGDLSEDDPARATEIQELLRDSILPQLALEHGVGWEQSGLAAQEDEFLSGAGLALGLCLMGIFLCLAWIFESWSRPLVVMSVIPFGLVGAVWGHWHWGVPLSLFSIVGMIGMAGIIINDAIVLISTVDDYSRRRGLFPAIADAVADRLRAVFLTTATTVLGLAPLLFEESSQAEFLKPTVITLSYGLGFGMILVLLVVPAVLAVQSDLGRMLRSARRGLRRRGPRGVLLAAGLGLAAAFAATFGPVLATGSAAGWIGAVLPGLAEAAPGTAAFVLFALAAVAIAAAVYGMAAVAARRPRRARLQAALRAPGSP